MKHIALTFIIILASVTAFAQNLQVRDFRIARDIEKSANGKFSTTHSSMKPYRTTLQTEISDSIVPMSDFVAYKLQNDNIYLNIQPVYELGGSYNFARKKDFRIAETAGAIIDFSLKGKLNINYMLTETYGYKNRMSYGNQFDELFPYNFDRIWGFYNDKNLARGFFLEQTFNINYTPVEFFSIEIGNGKHFYGDGKRSLLQSDICNNYPYLKVETEFLNFKYSCVWSMLDEGLYLRYLPTADWGYTNMKSFQERCKFNVTHYLDYRIGNHVNIAIFESVMSSKFLSFEYFNPVIFLRPLEFSMGSNENALLGVNMKVSFSQKNCIYGQVVLDDVIVGQLMNDVKHRLNSSYTGQYGWFANKWGIQGGLKFFDMFKVKGLDCFVEGNIVRPYTYSHSQQELTYTHAYKPLAHPLGANFVEGLCGISYFNDIIECSLEMSYAIVGCDSSFNSHFGQNVFYPTMDAYQPNQNNIPVSSYYNVLLQGIRTNVATVKLDIAYYPLKNKALSVFAEIAMRYNSNELRKDKYLGVCVGVRSRLIK